MADYAAKKDAIKAKFKRFDKNGDGMLDFNEFMNFVGNRMDNRTAHRLFSKVDTTNDGLINFNEFVDYIYQADSAAANRTSAGRQARLAQRSSVDTTTEDDGLWSECQSVFEMYGGSDSNFEGRDFMKLVMDCKLLDRRFKRVDVDLIFAKYKPKGGKNIDFEQFQNCVRAIAQKKQTSTKEVQLAVAERASIGVQQNATEADFVRFHDDKTTYTGMHTSNENHGDHLGGSDHGLGSRKDRLKAESAIVHDPESELPWESVQEAFVAFCKGDPFLDGKEFVQLCEDCNLFVKRKFEKADADIVFSKIKNRGERKIDFEQFKDACYAIASKRDCQVSDVQRKVIENEGPKMHGTTQAESVRFHDDPSTYTGMHAASHF
mmetsp:Transcript_114900/g.371342  ORF Transcript_114900/g.371342 Transcript_114900/m.371342 type:complete len:377 (-) Transcript_114900:323-1453(-)